MILFLYQLYVLCIDSLPTLFKGGGRVMLRASPYILRCKGNRLQASVKRLHTPVIHSICYQLTLTPNAPSSTYFYALAYRRIEGRLRYKKWTDPNAAAPTPFPF
uniref:Uncharacterized protein n=1 Tax=Coniferiporia sulphurascens TaxID=175648 RepID=A0A5B9RBC1_CONSH|nr:hypothetical protein PSUO_000070 [Coniferiporia sulphurascens]QEG57174.1 hypothetical protein PSUO_000070 [Coniferiporia sulphurascens]